MITVEIKENGKVIATLETKEDNSGSLNSWQQSPFYDSEELVYFSGHAQAKDRGISYSIHIQRPKEKT